MKSNDNMTMYIDKKTNIVDAGYIEDADRPVIAYHAEVTTQICSAAHEHPRAQLMYASSGVMRIYTSYGMWVVPPLQAVWVPGRISHRVLFREKTELMNLFFDNSLKNRLPDDCFVMKVSPLLRELVIKFCTTDSISIQNHMTDIIMDEVNDASEDNLSLPISDHPYAKNVIKNLIDNPSDRKTLDEWAATINTSGRNFSRIFYKETGMTFGCWRTKLKILRSLEMMQGGASVTETALELGYQSISSFIESFRKETGKSPLKYFNEKHQNLHISNIAEI